MVRQVVESEVQRTKREGGNTEEGADSDRKRESHPGRCSLQCVCVSSAVRGVNLRVDRSGKTLETACRVVLL